MIGSIKDGDPVRLEAGTFDEVVGVNLRGAWLTCKYVVHVRPVLPRSP